MPWTPRAVVFDFDGVIANTEDLYLGAYQEVFAKRGWTLDRRTYYTRYLGYDDRGMLREFAADNGLRLPVDEIELIMTEKEAAFLQRIAAGSVLYRGARECIDRIGARFPLAIATGALRTEVLEILTGAGLLDKFHAVVAADDVSVSKPSPEPYLAAAARLGVEPGECAAIEDSRGGLASAVGAGMRTIGITSTSPLQALGAATVIVDRLDQITVDLIESLADR